MPLFLLLFKKPKTSRDADICSKNSHKECFHLFQKLQFSWGSPGLSLDTFFCNNILQACSSTNLWSLPLAVLHEMWPGRAKIEAFVLVSSRGQCHHESKSWWINMNYMFVFNWMDSTCKFFICHDISITYHIIIYHHLLQKYHRYPISSLAASWGFSMVLYQTWPVSEMSWQHWPKVAAIGVRPPPCWTPWPPNASSATWSSTAHFCRPVKWLGTFEERKNGEKVAVELRVAGQDLNIRYIII